MNLEAKNVSGCFSKDAEEGPSSGLLMWVFVAKSVSGCFFKDAEEGLASGLLKSLVSQSWVFDAVRDSGVKWSLACRVDPVDFVRDSKQLVEYISKLTLNVPIMQPLPAAGAGGGGYGGGRMPGNAGG